jgi:uncharacterized protein YqgV (UPF0045/DUF77 family)
MLLELSVLPRGKGRQMGVAAIDLARIVDASGLSHQAKNKGTVLEGTWDQLMAVAKQCHDEVIKTNPKIVVVMRALDGPDLAGSDLARPDLAPCLHAPADCAAMKELPEDDGDWLIP